MRKFVKGLAIVVFVKTWTACCAFCEGSHWS